MSKLDIQISFFLQNMKKIIFFLIFFTSNLAYAETNLPKCEGENFKNWSDCYGEKKTDIYHYEGQWKNGKKNGNGKIYFLKTDEKYVGKFKNDLKEGMGIFYYKDKDVYVGFWKDDVRHGIGTKIYINGDIYHGEYKNGYRHGKGTFEYINGLKYEGNFKKGKRDGYGKQTFNGKVIKEGLWQDNELIK